MDSFWISILSGWAASYLLLLWLNRAAWVYIRAMWRGFLRSSPTRFMQRRVLSRCLSFLLSFLILVFSFAVFFLLSPVHLLLFLRKKLWEAVRNL